MARCYIHDDSWRDLHLTGKFKGEVVTPPELQHEMRPGEPIALLLDVGIDKPCVLDVVEPRGNDADWDAWYIECHDAIWTRYLCYHHSCREFDKLPDIRKHEASSWKTVQWPERCELCKYPEKGD